MITWGDRLDMNDDHPGPSFIHLTPPAPHTPPHTHLRSTQDLLARFHLLAAYDKHVRPFVTPLADQHDHLPPQPPSVPSDKAKGKEREREPPADTSPTPHTPGADGADGDDEDGTGHGEKKKKNNYKHLIKGVPGKHSMKKDDYLTTIMQVPPKQRIQITPFDINTQREAFSVNLDGLKGWNPNALILESAQAREDRKRRKELKKLAKAQALLPSTSLQPPPTAHAIPTHIITPTASHPPPTRTGTPKPSLPRPVSRPSTSAPTPGSATVPSFVRTPASGASPLSSSVYPPPVSEKDKEKRGKKREHQDSPVDMDANGDVIMINGTTTASKSTVVHSKAGAAGLKARPVKKQRVDVQGQARDITVPVQQPTPQGV